MKVASKALYNSLRISAWQDPDISVEAWQIEDWRALAQEELFKRLGDYGLVWDRATFISYANEYDSPEELVEDLIEQEEDELEEGGVQKQDCLYLLIFELWRRLVPEKQSLSLVCDELDEQIFAYDRATLERREPLEDALSSFYTLLQESLDNGLSHEEVFSAVVEYCANDIPSFLYDYMSELLDQHENSYAEELLEQFYPFMPEKCWFDLLLARLVAVHSTRQAALRIRQIFLDHLPNPDINLNFEILAYLSHGADIEFFKEVALHTIGLIDAEEDVVELLHVTHEFFGSYGRADIQRELERLMQRRSQLPREELLALLQAQLL